MWLVWLAAKITGASRVVRYSSPLTNGSAINRAKGRVTLSVSMARANRTGYLRDQPVS